MPMKRRGNATTLAEMQSQGLHGIASWLRCNAFSAERCRAALREAFPNASGAAINAAYRWVQNSNDASRDIGRQDRPTPLSEIPKGGMVPSGNKFGYTVQVTFIDPSTGLTKYHQVDIFSDKQLSKQEIDSLAWQEAIADGGDGISTNRISQTELPRFESATVLAHWRK